MSSEDKKLASVVATGEEFDPELSEDDTSPRGVILEILRNGKIAYISSGLEALTGQRVSHVMGTDIHVFVEQLLGKNAAKQLWPLMSEVLRGTRQFLESQVRGVHAVTNEERVYLIQIEASSPSFNRSVLFIQDQSNIIVSDPQVGLTQLNSMRILEKGNLFFLRTDQKLNVIEILGDTERILGVGRRVLEEKPELWLDLLSADQDSSLRKAFYRLLKKPRNFNREISFQHYQTKQLQYIFFSATPIFEQGKLVGWEGFGVDVTDKKNYELQLQAETKRYNTLYHVLSSVQHSNNPREIANLALDSMIDSTAANGGAVWFGADRDTGFELFAIRGLTESQQGNLAKYLQQENNILDYVCNNRYGLGLPDFNLNAKDYGLECLSSHVASMIAVPLVVSEKNKAEKVVGAFFLTSDQKNHFQSEDIELLKTVARQIAKITITAEYLQAEKKQADAINTLFQLSKSLTKSLTHLEIAQNSCQVIEGLFPIKRFWFGVMNSGGSHVQGIFGKGTGMRQQINEIQIELALRHDFLDQALHEKRPMLLDHGDRAECSGLNRFMEMLKPSCVLIIPLVSIGQVVGLIAIEPSQNSRERMLKNLTLLNSLSHEVASAILSRKFELQIANSDKMKTVSLLAAGVAHNFNNLLQAIIGQASILESKMAPGSPFSKPVQDIVTYAQRGADLVRQMSHLREIENLNQEVLDLCELIQKVIDTQRLVYGSKINLVLDLIPKQAIVFADRKKLINVLESLIKNSAEAVFDENKNEVLVRLSARRVLSHEVSAELAPGNYYQVDIIDDGVGMDQEQLKHCFEPFFTTKNRDSESGLGFAASGLGLANSFNVVKGHGGIIVASSYVNLGSTFSLYLPEYNKDKSAYRKPRPEKEIALQQFVLIAGTDQLEAKAVKAIEQQKYQLLRLKNRAQTISYLSRSDFRPAVLMVDVDNAGADLIDFFQVMRDQYPNIKIIVFSSEIEHWQGALRYFVGISYLSKPVQLMDLHKILVNFSEQSAISTLIDRVEDVRLQESDD